ASSLLEEDEEYHSNNEDSQGIPLHTSTNLASSKSRAPSILRADASPSAEMDGASEASDEEIPHSFMVETSPSTRKKSSSSQKRAHRSAIGQRFPHPDDIEEEDEDDQNAALLRASNVSSHPSKRRKGKETARGQNDSKKGLDEYQQALWRWVNVYNLDEYLQEITTCASPYLDLIFHFLRVSTPDILLVSTPSISNAILLFAFTEDPRCGYSYFTLVDRRFQGNVTDASSENHGTSTAKLDAHDIANRIMRQENYLIALFNKDLLELQLPVPAVVEKALTIVGFCSADDADAGRRRWGGDTLTRALEWNLRFCLMDYLFDRSGKVKDVFLKERSRDVLIQGYFEVGIRHK
ncbi:10123_t:CDS:2, partial [Acaulospora colombiana]